MNNPNKSLVCTLFEGAYEYGLGVLINSLLQNGFRGRILAGYRGSLPSWVSQLRASSHKSNSVYEITAGCELEFVQVQTNTHFTNHKARFVIDVLAQYRNEANNIYYFDPDVVVRCRWPFFEEWVRDGVALCEDVNWRMPDDHPLRNAWREYFDERGIKLNKPRNAYYNAGFVGTSQKNSSFFSEWNDVLNLCDFDRNVLVGDDRTYLFKGVDQDALNIVTMKTELPLSTIGPDGMDFQPGGGGFVMCHAIGEYKPWNHSYTWKAITKGKRLGRADRWFLKYANQPIQVFSNTHYQLKRIDRWIAGALSRFLN